MCASVNRNKQVRAGSTSKSSSRKSSIGSSRSTRSNRTDDLVKLLGEKTKQPIANFQVPTVEHKKDLHVAHGTTKAAVDPKKENEKNVGVDKKSLKKVKKPEAKGLLHSFLSKVKSFFS